MEKIQTAPSAPIVRTDWQQLLPVLTGARVQLRELRHEDAAALCGLLSTEEVARFISPPPPTVEGFERFMQFALAQRVRGEHVGFAVTLRGFDTAIGIFQVRRLEAGFRLAEWGFAIGAPFWGSGVFEESADLVLDFAFETLGVQRLEARAAVLNGRGNGALRKIGAVQECLLRRSLLRGGAWLDQALYAILGRDYVARNARRVAAPRFH